jgi:hypothetical protein
MRGMKLRPTIIDLIWLLLVVALAVCWGIDHQLSRRRIEQVQRQTVVPKIQALAEPETNDHMPQIGPQMKSPDQEAN